MPAAETSLVHWAAQSACVPPPPQAVASRAQTAAHICGIDIVEPGGRSCPETTGSAPPAVGSEPLDGAGSVPNVGDGGVTGPPVPDEHAGSAHANATARASWDFMGV
jgi:hypothetical protein